MHSLQLEAQPSDTLNGRRADPRLLRTYGSGRNFMPSGVHARPPSHQLLHCLCVLWTTAAIFQAERNINCAASLGVL